MRTLCLMLQQLPGPRYPGLEGEKRRVLVKLPSELGLIPDSAIGIR